MPSADVRFPLPLTRLNPWYPGQYGVPGAWTETGERMHCTGAVFYVDPNHTDANDNRDGTDPTSPLATVATALTKCQAYRGDVIAVMANNAWQYANSADGYTTPIQESVTVSVPGVRIVGVCPSGALGVYWRPGTAGGTCITVNAIDVAVEGFAFYGNTGGAGIYAEWDGTNYHGENLTVRHCFFADDIDTAIQLEYSWYADIHDNVFDECDEYGIYTSNSSGDAAYVRIHHNWFHDCTTSAIWLPESDRCHIYENTIYNNDAATNAAGTTANCMVNLANGSRNSVHNNTMACVLPAAVAWDYDACNTAGTGDMWCQNYLRDGVSVTNPT